MIGRIASERDLQQLQKEESESESKGEKEGELNYRPVDIRELA